MQLVIDTNGVSVRARSGSFLVSGKAGKRTISPKLLSGILVLSDCLISSQAICLAVHEGIPIQFFDNMGGPIGCVWSARLESLPKLRRNQVHFEADRPVAARWSAVLYGQKAAGQLENLRSLGAGKVYLAGIENVLPQLEPSEWENVADFEQKLMQVEAQIAKVYWDAVSALLPSGYAFDNRSRQPADDMFNAALNYLYGMLYNTVEGAIFAAGLDPYLGIVHADEYNKPTLAFDLIEPFRPWCDRLLIDLCRSEQLEAAHFEPREKSGLWLSKTGKRLLIPAFEGMMNAGREWNGKTLSAKNHIFQYAGELAQMLREYRP